MSSERLLRFYQGRGQDAQGRTLERLWALPRAELEADHGFIQWLFPLDEPSDEVPNSPILLPGERQGFLEDAMVHRRLELSFNLMLDFYALERVEASDGVVIRTAPRFPRTKGTWLYPQSHHYARLSRIMGSMALFGHRSLALALRECLLTIADDSPASVGPVTRLIWTSAVSDNP